MQQKEGASLEHSLAPKTLSNRYVLAEPNRLLVADDSHPVRSRHGLQRAVALADIVEIHPDRNELI